MREKQQLREQIKQQLAALSPQQISRRSHSVWHNLENLEPFESAEKIALYYSFGNELSTRAFIDRWHKKKRLYLPVIDGRDMFFVEFNSHSDMVANRYGILEPKDRKIIESDFDIMVVPALGYDRTCHRLGRGGGYYDRYLSNNPLEEALKVGVCLDCQLIDHIPTESFDIDMELIISESEIIRPK